MNARLLSCPRFERFGQPFNNSRRYATSASPRLVSTDEMWAGGSAVPSRQGGMYRSKKARIRDNPAGPRSEPAFSLNWITSRFATTRPDAKVEGPLLLIHFVWPHWINRKIRVKAK